VEYTTWSKNVRLKSAVDRITLQSCCHGICPTYRTALNASGCTKRTSQGERKHAGYTNGVHIFQMRCLLFARLIYCGYKSILKPIAPQMYRTTQSTESCFRSLRISLSKVHTGPNASNKFADVDGCLLDCDIVWTCRWVPKFRRNILLPSSEHHNLEDDHLPVFKSIGNIWPVLHFK
jgi:hypothetical protein